MHELGVSVGKYRMYRDLLEEIEPERALYLAVPLHVYDGIFSEPLGQLMIRREDLQIIVFDDKRERICLWTP